MTNAYEPEQDSQIAYLLKLAGRRPSPSSDRLQRAHNAARAEWQRARRARARRWWLIASAAAVVAVGCTAWLWTSRPMPIVEQLEIATVQSAIGTVRVTTPDKPQATGQITEVSRALRAGDRVEVASGGRAAFQIIDGASVRVAPGTTVVFRSTGRIELTQGTVYVDADPAGRSVRLAVETPFGTVSHSGTQFELRLRPESLDVRVREGEVSVEGREGRLTSRAGEALLVRRDRPAERRQISTSGPEWAWVTAMAPPFTLEGATVPAFLGWVSREQGWRWEYSDAATRQVAERTILHGSIDGLGPGEALLAVLPASGLTSTLDGDRLLVKVQTR